MGEQPRFVLHPILLAGAYVLNMGLANEVEPVYIARPLLVATAGASALLLLAWAIFRDRWAGALSTTIAISLILSLVPLLRVWQFLDGVLGYGIGLVVVTLSLIGILGGVSIMVLRSVREGRPVPRPAPGLLNIFAAALVAIVVLPHLVGWLSAALGTGRASPVIPEVSSSGGESPPDIVIILLDSYPRADVLERRFGIDNEPFLQALRDRGFDVGEASRSNYTFTSASLASLFQMRHIEEVATLEPLIGIPRAHRSALRAAAADSPGIAILRSAGYEIITVPSGWLHASLAAAADRVLDHGEINNFERKLLELTWLMDVVDVVWPAAMTHSQRNRIVRAFDDLERFAHEQRDAPAFFFAHIPAPHLPLVLDAEGNTLPLPSRAFEATPPDAMEQARAEYLAAWEAELAYVNRRVLDAIDALQAVPRPPAIIVMSDHGYGDEPHPQDMQSLFGILFAASTPSAPGLLAETSSPVNLLPILFNRYLGTDIPLSPDRYFVGPADDRPLLLTEISDPEQVPPTN